MVKASLNITGTKLMPKEKDLCGRIANYEIEGNNSGVYCTNLRKKSKKCLKNQ